jgi:hypothetical protein
MKLEITGYLAENMDAPHGIALHGSVSAKQLAQAMAESGGLRECDPRTSLLRSCQ